MRPGVFLGGALLLQSYSAQECYLPIDVVFLQDTTGSFEDDLPNVMRQIPDLIAAILRSNPESYFAVTEFKDKPYYFVGDEHDFCFKVNGPLTPFVDEFEHYYSTLYASGGGDLPEAQFQALINVVESAEIGWRPLQRPVPREGSSSSGAHLCILLTDAKPHLPQDYYDYLLDVGTEIAEVDLLPNPGVGSGISENDLCLKYNYPSDLQVRDALFGADVYLAILTPDDDSRVVDAWKYVNEKLLNQPTDFYQIIKNDSSDLLQGVLAAIRSVTETACRISTTTSTSTTASTTLTPTPPTTASTVPTIATTTEFTVTTGTPTTTAAPVTTITPSPTTSGTTESTLPTITSTTEFTVTTGTPTTTASTEPTVPTITSTTEFTVTTGTPTTTASTATTITPTTITPTTTNASATTTTRTTVPSTTPSPTVTQVGSTLPATSCPTRPPGCPTTCPPDDPPCCQRAAIIVKINDRPKKLVIDYEK